MEKDQTKIDDTELKDKNTDKEKNEQANDDAKASNDESQNKELTPEEEIENLKDKSLFF